MWWKKMLLILPVCALMIGCGKEEGTIEEKLKSNEFYTALGKTPKTGVPTKYEQYKTTKGDTSWPKEAWRNVGEPEVTYEIKVSGDEADIPIQVKWPDTVVVVYTDIPDTSIRDTVIKPSPYFSGDMTFHYEIMDKEWELTSITPADVKSDSAGSYVKLDSIKCDILNRETDSIPVLKDPSALISVFPREDYPYRFKVGDSVKITVYVSGTSDSKFVLLFAPAPDLVPDWFSYNDEDGSWYGTWTIKATGHHWAWIDVADIDIILDPDVTAPRATLWGIPYIVE